MEGRHAGRLSERSLARRRERSEAKAKRFICGPIPLDWIQRAARIGGKCCAVALAIWFKRGVTRRTADLEISPTLLSQFGVGTKTGAILLRRLADADLIGLVRTPGRCPRVTILEWIGDETKEA